MMASNEILYVFACAGHGTRLRQKNSIVLPKVLCPLDEAKGLTPLEYHLRMLIPQAQIAISAGHNKDEIMKYLEKNEGFGHNWRNFYWIPERYQAPEILTKSAKFNVPNFPLGAGAWLAHERSFINELMKKGILIIVQTDGNKVGERSDVVAKMVKRIQKSKAEWIVAVYNDVEQQDLKKPDWFRRFDTLINGKGYPKGYAPSPGMIVAGWYVFRINCLNRLWNSNIQKSIQENKANFPQTRQMILNNEVIDLRIKEINMPLLLQYFQLETFGVSRSLADLGIGLKTPSDISRCKEIFEKRELEGVLRKR